MIAGVIKLQGDGEGEYHQYYSSSWQLRLFFRMNEDHAIEIQASSHWPTGFTAYQSEIATALSGIIKRHLSKR